METLQHIMTSTLNTLVSLGIKQWQWRCHLINLVFVRKQMDINGSGDVTPSI